MDAIVVSPEIFERRFREIGVRFELAERRPWFGIDVRREGGRERIVLSPGEASVQVIDSDPEEEQLLLLVKEGRGYGSSDEYVRPTTQMILCGRDERSLFTVRVPRRLGVAVNSVAAAHEALKPAEIRDIEAGTDSRRPRRRRGRAFVRQGDWFFVPRPDLPLDLPGARKRGRLSRWGGNSHVVDHLLGNARQFYSEFARRPGDGPLFARGFVRHHEHRPVHLRCWHRVFANTAISTGGSYND